MTPNIQIPTIHLKSRIGHTVGPAVRVLARATTVVWEAADETAAVIPEVPGIEFAVPSPLKVTIGTTIIAVRAVQLRMYRAFALCVWLIQLRITA
jgi:hypothetical protein